MKLASQLILLAFYEKIKTTLDFICGITDTVYAYSKSKANLSYYRDSNAKEIDIFIEENDTIHPIEIKKSATPDKRETKKYSVIDKTTLQRGCGGIVCMCEEVIPIDSQNCFIPSNII